QGGAAFFRVGLEVGDGGQGVVVGDEEVALALVLQVDVLADGAEVVAQVQLARRLHAAEDSFGHGRSSRAYLLYSSTVVPAKVFAAREATRCRPHRSGSRRPSSRPWGGRWRRPASSGSFAPASSRGCSPAAAAPAPRPPAGP